MKRSLNYWHKYSKSLPEPDSQVQSPALRAWHPKTVFRNVFAPAQSFFTTTGQDT